MKGHLLKYPISVDKNGMIAPTVKSFPDFPASKVAGSTVAMEKNMAMFY